MKKEITKRIAFGFRSEMSSARRNNRAPSAGAPSGVDGSEDSAGEALDGAEPRARRSARIAMPAPTYARYAAPAYLMTRNSGGYARSSEATPSAAAAMRVQSPRNTPAAAR